MRVDGKPIFVIFAPHDLPSTTSFIAHWRQLAEAAGLPGIYFVAISNIHAPGVDRYRDAIGVGAGPDNIVRRVSTLFVDQPGTGV